MKSRKIFLFVFFFLTFFCSLSQNNRNTKQNIGERGYLRIVSYNVENYFDPFNDSLKNDDEFTPEGARHWTWEKYKNKQKKIYKVLTAIGEWEMPEIVGLCEVENRFVLEDLIKSTPMKWNNYDFIHYESPDNRGIDVALLYRKDKFKVLESKYYRIIFPWDTTRKTRDILYVKGITSFDDTLFIFMNHWPSRLSGQAETEKNRIFVARILRQAVDSIFNSNIFAKIIIMGDFNDEPDNTSITEELKALKDISIPWQGQLYNLSWALKEKGKGSIKFQGQWGLIDQIIVSGSLLMNSSNLYTTPNDIHIFDADFLTEPDEAFVGFKPFRTFIGYKYNDGFSDHYPIYIDLRRK
ncbi:MAG: hypothetical protein N3A01_01870 [Bacteroidales bacterium]|nr:hypothetical protein [Bacteroidales bacterium]